MQAVCLLQRGRQHSAADRYLVLVLDIGCSYRMVRLDLLHLLVCGVEG